MKKIFLLLWISTAIISAQSVLTTTSWVKAYADAAGVKDSYSFAPLEMNHPPEYELIPSDIKKISRADVIIYAGYEGMVKKFREVLNIPENKLLQVKTGYDMATIKATVRSIADFYGNMDKAESSLEKIAELYKSFKSRYNSSGLDTKNYIVNFHQQSLAREMGLNVVGVFGPGPLNPNQLLEFKKSGGNIIIDNNHAPIGKALKEVLPEAEYYQFINFPGNSGTKSLEDVINYNLEQLFD